MSDAPDTPDTWLPPKSEIVGHRIVEILGDSSLSDSSFNYTDFVYRTDNGHAFRMPTGNIEIDDLWPRVEITEAHKPLAWPTKFANHFQRNLWSATIAEIAIRKATEDRDPDSGIIILSSGWSVCQRSVGPMGIAPCVEIVERSTLGDSMISLWDCR